MRHSIQASLRALTCTALLMTGTSVQAVEWGTAGVLSQQGQRLKVAVPYSDVGARSLSVVQFTVVSSAGPAGSFSPEPSTFTISKAPETNLVIFQSAEPVYAGSINLIVRVASEPDSAVRYELKIPSGR